MARVPGRIGKGKFTSPYIDLHLAFVTKDERKHDIGRLKEVVKMKDLEITTVNEFQIILRRRALPFPYATIVHLEIPINSSTKQIQSLTSL